MAAPQKLVSPNLQNANSVPNPIPNANGAAGPMVLNSPVEDTAIEYHKPMVITPGENPPPGQGSSGNGQADLGDFSSLPAAAQAPEAQDLGDFHSLPDAAPKSVGGMTGQLGVVELPDGKFGVKEHDGSIRNLTEHEKQAAKYAAIALRMGGPVVGALLGGSAGLPAGPAASAALAGVGSVTGGEAAHEQAQFFERLAGEHPRERGVVDRAVEAVAPGIGGALAGSQIPSMAETSLGEATASGAASANVKAQQNLQASQEAQIPLRKDQINEQNPDITGAANKVAGGSYGKTEAYKLQTHQIDQNNQVVDRVNELSNRAGPKMTGAQAKNYSFKDVMKEIRADHEIEISEPKQKALDLAGDREFSVKDLISRMEQIASEKGITDGPFIKELGRLKRETRATKLPPLPSTGVKSGPPYYDSSGKTLPNKPIPGVKVPAVPKGVTLDRLNKLTMNAQENANFGNDNRTPTDRAWGELAHDAKEVRDHSANQVLLEHGKTKDSARLMNGRAAYHADIDTIKLAAKRVKQDPMNMAKKLIRPDETEFAVNLARILPEADKKLLARQLIDNAFESQITDAGMLTAAKFEQNLKSINPKVRDAYFEPGLQDEIKKLVRVAKVIERRNLTSTSVESDSAMKAAIKMVKSPAISKFDELAGFVARLFKDNAKAKYYMDQVVSEHPNTVSGKPSESLKSDLADVARSNPKKTIAGSAAAGATMGEMYRNRKEANRSPQSVKDDFESVASRGREQAGINPGKYEMNPVTIQAGESLEFKEPKFKAAFDKLPEALKERAYWIDSYMNKHFNGYNLRVSSVSEKVKGRTSNTHQEGRAIDFHSGGLTPKQIMKLKYEVDKKYGYNTLVYHRIPGGKYHFHLQITRKQVGTTEAGKKIREAQQNEED